MANYLENTWAKISSLFDFADNDKKPTNDLMSFGASAGNTMLGLLSDNKPPTVIDKSRYATTENVVPNQDALNVNLLQGYQENIIPDSRGKMVEMSPLSNEYGDAQMIVPGYVPKVQELKTPDQTKDEMESTLLDNTMQNIQKVNQTQDTKGLIDLTSMADAGSYVPVISDSQESVIQQTSMSAPEKSKISTVTDAVSKANQANRFTQEMFDKTPIVYKEDKNVNEQIEQGDLEPGVGQKIKDYLSDEENMLKMARAFNTMRLEPDDSLGKSIDERLKVIQKNKGVTATVQQVRQMALTETDPVKQKKLLDAAAMMEANPNQSSEIYKTVISDMISSKGDKETWEKGWKITQGFIKEDSVKEFGKQSASFRRVLDSAQNPSAAGDLALIFNFMKTLDPGSVVRESEFANAASARAAITRNKENGRPTPAFVEGAINRLMNGQRLLDDQRNDFVMRARDIFSGGAEQYLDKKDYYRKQATNAGVNPDEVIGNPFDTNIKFIEPKVSFEDLSDTVKSKYEIKSKKAFDDVWKTLTYLDKVELLMSLRK